MLSDDPLACEENTSTLGGIELLSASLSSAQTWRRRGSLEREKHRRQRRRLTGLHTLTHTHTHLYTCGKLACAHKHIRTLIGRSLSSEFVLVLYDHAHALACTNAHMHTFTCVHASSRVCSVNGLGNTHTLSHTRMHMCLEATRAMMALSSCYCSWDASL